MTSISKGSDNEKRSICVSIPCYNEEDNIVPLVAALEKVFAENLADYDWTIQFIDNKSIDRTRDRIEEVCSKNEHVRAIYNVKNFGPVSGYHGFLSSKEDCVITMAADFQEPVEVIPDMVEAWERGAKVVCAVKAGSKEKGLIKQARKAYYRLLRKYSNIDIIQDFSGFGLYDKEFVRFLRDLDEPLPYMRALVAEFGYEIELVPYVQQRRRSGKSKNNLVSLYDTAMRSFVTYTKTGLRAACMIGFVIALGSMLVAIGYLVYKLTHWNSFDAGIAPLLIGVFFFGSVQMCLLGILGEYVITMNRRLMHRPYVIEEKRINF